MRHAKIHCVAALVLVATATSCSALIQTGERQCKRDADCVASDLGTMCVDEVCVSSDNSPARSPREGSCSNDDDCIDSAAPRCLKSSCVSREIANRWVCPSDDPMARPTTIRYGFYVVDFLSRMPPDNVVVLACRNNDVNCDQPVATFTDTQKTGHVQFELPTGFFGFFEVRSDSLTTLLYVTAPIVRNALNRDLPVLTSQTVDLLSASVGYPYDPKNGLALLEALDCTDIPAGGIQFEIEGASADQFYVVDQVPSRDATLTVYDATNNTANGGFLNVEPGFVTFKARLGEDGLQLGSFNARIRANTITFIDMHF